MTTVLLLKAEDIISTINGKHFIITTKDGTIINFDEESVKELYADIKLLIFKETSLK